MATHRKLSNVIPDATALKALAHPIRMRMLGMLRLDGPATATGLAAALGLNSGATSYHLRQLAAHGFIEEDPGHLSRRDRWWRARHELTSFFPDGATQEQFDAGIAFAQAALTQQVEWMQQAQEEFSGLPAEWQAASTNSDFTLFLTAEQARVLKDRIVDLLIAANESAPRPEEPKPDGTEPYVMTVHAFPFPGRIGKRGDERK
jgi:DNA-binding transcriptional ArsR family regulator